MPLSVCYQRISRQNPSRWQPCTS